MTQAYLVHKDVVCKRPSATHFDASIRVFVHQEYTPAEPLIPIQASIQEASQDIAERVFTLEDVRARLGILRQQLSETRNR